MLTSRYPSKQQKRGKEQCSTYTTFKVLNKSFPVKIMDLPILGFYLISKIKLKDFQYIQDN